MAGRTIDTDLAVTGTVNATIVQEGGAALALKSEAWTFVDARTDAGTARPTGWAGVIWLCDVTGNATNAVVPDIIIREDEAV